MRDRWLGPAGPELITAGALELLAGADAVYLRTRRHPSASALAGAGSFDHHYERGATFDDVYASIVEDLVAAARAPCRAGRWSMPCRGRRRWPSAPSDCCGTTRPSPLGRWRSGCIRRCPSSTWPSTGWGSTR